MCSIQIVSTPFHYLKAVSVGATSGSQECKPTKHRGGSEEPLIAWIQLTGQPPGHVLSMTSPNRHPRVKVRVLVTQPCPALCNPMDCSPPGSSVHGISQTKILNECVVGKKRKRRYRKRWNHVCFYDANGLTGVSITTDTRCNSEGLQAWHFL